MAGSRKDDPLKEVTVDVRFWMPSYRSVSGLEVLSRTVETPRFAEVIAAVRTLGGDVVRVRVQDAEPF